jgi:hypothetical protein
VTWAHGNRHDNHSPCHKLEFWNGQFHLSAMIFWLALTVAAIAQLIKLIRQLRRCYKSNRNEKGGP